MSKYDRIIELYEQFIKKKRRRHKVCCHDASYAMWHSSWKPLDSFHHGSHASWFKAVEWNSHIYIHSYNIANTWLRLPVLSIFYSVYLFNREFCDDIHMFNFWHEKFTQLKICIKTLVFVTWHYIFNCYKCSMSSIASQKKFITFQKAFVWNLWIRKKKLGRLHYNSFG